MNFDQAMSTYQQLRGKLSRGSISPKAFEEAVSGLLVTDAQGQTWTIGAQTGKWYRLAGGQWVEDAPKSTAQSSAYPAAPKKSNCGILAIAGVTAVCLISLVAVALLGGIAGFTFFNAYKADVDTPASLDAATEPDLIEPVGGPEDPAAPAIPTEAAQIQPTQASPADPPPSGNGLSKGGPWIVLPAWNGIWAMNPDGTGLTQVVAETILGPQNLRDGVHPDGQKIAYITASDAADLQGLVIKLLDLKTGQSEVLTRLSSDQNEPPANAELCSPAFEAARAATIGNGLAWSPDGKDLAFVGRLEGSTSDVYRLNLETRKITRLTNGDSQAFDVHWSKNGWIVHFGASCFGTGAGFAMTGAWATRFDNGDTVDLYQPDPNAMYEQFMGWAYSEVDAFVVATASGCPYRDLRIVEVETGQVTPIHSGCMDDVAQGPTGAWYVLAGPDASDQPGLYMYMENSPGMVIPPAYVPIEDGSSVRTAPNGFALVERRGQAGLSYESYDWKGRPGEFTGQGAMPWINAEGNLWATIDQGRFTLAGVQIQPVVLTSQEVAYPFWYEEYAGNQGLPQHLLFYSQPEGSLEYALYQAVQPDFEPQLLGEGMQPGQTPFWVFAP